MIEFLTVVATFITGSTNWCLIYREYMDDGAVYEYYDCAFSDWKVCWDTSLLYDPVNDYRFCDVHPRRYERIHSDT